MRTVVRFAASSLVALQMLAMPGCIGCKGEGSSASAPASTAANAATAATPEKCEHGVQKDICTRCNPALAVAFKAKNDWCNEHERAESQCVLCHPDLAQKGIK